MHLDIKNNVIMVQDAKRRISRQIEILEEKKSSSIQNRYTYFQRDLWPKKHTYGWKGYEDSKTCN